MSDIEISENSIELNPEPAKLEVGQQAIAAYSRLSYTMWNALAEFIDNSTQSRLNHDGIIDDVLATEGLPLIVSIEYNRIKRTITISDNSIGMDYDKLVASLRIAHPTADSRGRSKYGMGLKTAACWIGHKWSIVTAQWGEGIEYTALVDVAAIAGSGAAVPISARSVSKDDHYTKIIISELHRNIQARTEDTIRGFLGSMYRFDIESGRLKLLYDGEEIPPPEALDLDTDPSGNVMRTQLPEKMIGDKKVTGWFGIMRKGGRKFGGFSLFQNERQIQGYPNAWKPRSIFGGIDDEGANNLIVQRLTGLLNLDGFNVSHTKDAILFSGDEEEQLEQWLVEQTKDYRTYAAKRRGPKASWSREKVKDLIASMKSEFINPEMQDTVIQALLPPLEAIQANNQKQLAALTDDDEIETFEVSAGLKVIVSLVERSEYEPHVTLVAGALPGTIHVIINGLHPYYASLDSGDAIEECLKQYVYDAIAQYRVSKLSARVTPDSVSKYKDHLLRVNELHAENVAAAVQDGSYEAKVG